MAFIHQKGSRDGGVKEDVEVLKLERDRNPIPLGLVILTSTEQSGKEVCFFFNKQEFKCL